MTDVHIVIGRWRDQLGRHHVACSCGVESYAVGESWANSSHDAHIVDAIRTNRAADKAAR